MERFIKYYFLFSFITFFALNSHSQYLCDYECEVIKKQIKVIKKKAYANANLWILDNADNLNLPVKLKLSKIEIKTQGDWDELKKWSCIDSLLCVNRGTKYIDLAIDKMNKMKLAVYDIRTYFIFANTTNPEIRSILYFQFDINGNLIRAVIREKENSPYSEKYYH